MNGHDVRPAKWSNVIDLYDDGDYSAIWGRYENAPLRVLGVRWNGYGEGKGFPLASGHPVWHIEPDYLTWGILVAFLEQTLSVTGSEGHKDNILTAMSEFAMRRERNGIHLAIALYAASNRGKTTTLNMLIDNLKSVGAKVIDDKPVWEGSLDRLFCCKYKGKTIGVATGGDEANLIERAFDFFNKYNCDVVFCPTRSRSDSSSWKAFCEKTFARHVRVLSIRKTEVELARQTTVNMAQAKELMSLIITNGVT